MRLENLICRVPATNNNFDVKLKDLKQVRYTYYAALLVAMLSFGTAQAQQTPVMQKFYLATLQMQGRHLPVQLMVSLYYFEPGNYMPFAYTIINGDENISGQIIPTLQRDSFKMEIPVFNSAIIFATTPDAEIFNGRFYDYSRPGNYYLPFIAEMLADNAEDTRFPCAAEAPPTVDFSGKWDAVFYDQGVPDSTVGIFEQQGKYLKGTFLTTTGDYRFLAGNVCGNKMFLSAFDGSHAFLFSGEMLADGTIKGNFYSGSHFTATFIAAKNPNAKLPDPEKLTYLKPGYTTIDFTFPDASGKPVSLSDPQFANKAVIITITGSWCPNCMDETSYLSEIEETYKAKGLEIIALSFERKTDSATFAMSIQKVRDHFGTEFTYLNAGLPKTASDALPMLNKVMGFPTMILLDRNHEVVSIHTGFSGPATNKLFVEFQQKFEKELLEALR